MKDDVDDIENVIWKCNVAFLQSFLGYSKSFGLQRKKKLSCNSVDKSGLEMERKNDNL